MAKTSRIIAGRRSQFNGAMFEMQIISQAQRDEFAIVKIPTGSKTFKNKIIRQRSDFDFFMGKNSKAIFFDAKSWDKDHLTFSMLNMNQLFSLRKLEMKGFVSGYVCNLRKSNQVVFFSASTLLSSKGPIYTDQSVLLGSIDNFSFEPLIRLYDYGPPVIYPTMNSLPA